MSTATVLSPPPEVLIACDELDGVLAAFLKARNSLKGYGQCESTAEALLLFNLVVRQVEGVLVLCPPQFGGCECLMSLGLFGRF